MSMYNVVEYSPNYSETIRSLQFYSKNDFNADIANTDNFKSFEYKTNLSENTENQTAPNQANGILKNATIILPLKYLSNFWRSLEIPLINCKVELKLNSRKHYVLSANGNHTANANANANNIIFTIKDTKLYVLLLTLSAKDNQKLSKILSKRLERSVC